MTLHLWVLALVGAVALGFVVVFGLLMVLEWLFGLFGPTEFGPDDRN